MNKPDYNFSGNTDTYAPDALRLEVVTTSVGFDDFLDFTLGLNHAQADHYIVVTSHDDEQTAKVCLKHSVTCVKTDLFGKNGRRLNKGAAINVGMGNFQYHGWRLHLDADIALPDNFRRLLFNHSHLERDCLYGADRVDVIGPDAIKAFLAARLAVPQHAYKSGLSSAHGGAVHCPHATATGARFVDDLFGYCPIGFFQLWHASQQRNYPHSLGTAAHDDVLFAQSWPESKRRLLPSAICYHISTAAPYYGQNWDGQRKQPRLER